RRPVLELEGLYRGEVERLAERPLVRVLDERREERLRRLDGEVDRDLLELVVDLPEVLQEPPVEAGPVGEVLARFLGDGRLRLHEILAERRDEVVLGEVGRLLGRGRRGDGASARASCHRKLTPRPPTGVRYLGFPESPTVPREAGAAAAVRRGRADARS